MKHRLEYALVKAIFVAVRLMPDPLVRAAGTLLGLDARQMRNARRRRCERSTIGWYAERTS